MLFFTCTSSSVYQHSHCSDSACTSCNVCNSTRNSTQTPIGRGHIKFIVVSKVYVLYVSNFLGKYNYESYTKEKKAIIFTRQNY